jgi:hypothetical protein
MGWALSLWNWASNGQFVQYCKTFWILVKYVNSSRHQIACFKVTAKSYNVATRAAEPRRVKTARNPRRNKTSNTVLVTVARSNGGRSPSVALKHGTSWRLLYYQITFFSFLLRNSKLKLSLTVNHLCFRCCSLNSFQFPTALHKCSLLYGMLVLKLPVSVRRPRPGAVLSIHDTRPALPLHIRWLDPCSGPDGNEPLSYSRPRYTSG